MAEYIVRETGYPGAIKQEVVGEVVRCKDCKFQGHVQRCPFGKRTMPHANGYCCYGERRDNAEIH